MTQRSGRASGTIAVIGEALIDIVETGDDEPRPARPGGSPFNVAVGLARLGRPAAFVGRLSHDPLGTILRRHAQRSNVDLSLSVDAHETTTVALVELVDGIAEYRFGVDATADFRWTDAELAGVLTADVVDELGALHFGSLVSWTPPGDEVVLRRVAAVRARVPVSYDPNIRPLLQPDRGRARAQVEQALPLADLVKTSDEDLAWLYPGRDCDEIARDWLAFGPSLVVVTRGSEGSVAHTADGAVRRPVLPIDVVDTVGAGDAFMAGLLDSLARHGLLDRDRLGNDLEALGPVLEDAALVAGITCSRAGANPPRAAELDLLR